MGLPLLALARPVRMIWAATAQMTESSMDTHSPPIKLHL